MEGAGEGDSKAFTSNATLVDSFERHERTKTQDEVLSHLGAQIVGPPGSGKRDTRSACAAEPKGLLVQ